LVASFFFLFLLPPSVSIYIPTGIENILTGYPN
jgi:hypothetical protein